MVTVSVVLEAPRKEPQALSISGDKLNELQQAIGMLTYDSRFYIRGHGDWEQRKTALDLQLSNSTSSFAGQLHYQLGTKYNIRGDLHGRIYCVNILGDNMATEKMSDLHEEHGTGAKVTTPADIEGHKRRYLKIRFFWDNGQQRAAWVDY